MPAPRPLLAQSDGTLLLYENDPQYEEARLLLRDIAELQKRPGTLHTYRLTPVTLWNAAASGRSSADVVARLSSLCRFGLPRRLEDEIRRQMDRYGRMKLLNEAGSLALVCETPGLLEALARRKEIAEALVSLPEAGRASVRPEKRGWIKRELAAVGYPVLDDAGFRAGEALDVRLRSENASGQAVCLRDYQLQATEAFLGDAARGGGSGIVVLPCGAGKTWIGMSALARLKCDTLILTPNGMSVSQWIDELLRNTTLAPDQIGEYTGHAKNVKPVTVATYQVLTHRRASDESFPHWKLFADRNWGLIIYDEVHLLPAPVFRMTADIQATRRLGLTATLVREDGREGDTFALIGPKRYEMPWKTMEDQGWIAEAECTEVRVPMEEGAAFAYAKAPKKQKHRIAGENPAKKDVVKQLLRRHEGIPTLVIGQYLDQLHEMAEQLSLPLITGEMPHRSRKILFERFKKGDIGVLLVSKVANFAVDLPDATVAIQISGSYGSRQEEAQRLGRILRPKGEGTIARFYSIVSEGTDEVEFSRNRGRFLLEQGYPYSVDRWGRANADAAGRPTP